MANDVINKPKRPGPVTAVAVLCLLFGGIGLVAYLCLMGGFGLIGYLSVNPLALQPGQPDPLALFKKVDQLVPSMKYYFMVRFICVWVLCVVEVIAGLKLLKMRYSGRKLAIVYAVCSIVLAIADFGYDVAAVQPVSAEMEKAVADSLQDMFPKPAGDVGGNNPAKNTPKPNEAVAEPPKGAAPAVPANPFAGNPLLKSISGIVGTAVSLLYPCIILFVMFLPSTRKAFAIANGDARPDVTPGEMEDRQSIESPDGSQARGAPSDDEFRYTARDE